jgi:hypothetical protein
MCSADSPEATRRSRRASRPARVRVLSTRPITVGPRGVEVDRTSKSCNVAASIGMWPVLAALVGRRWQCSAAAHLRLVPYSSGDGNQRGEMTVPVTKFKDLDAACAGRHRLVECVRPAGGKDGLARHSVGTCLVIALSCATSGQAQGPENSVKDIVIGLGQSRVAAGVVMSLREFVNAEKQSSTPRRLAAEQRSAAQTADSLNLFERTHPEFVVDRRVQRVRFVQRDTPAEVMEKLSRVGIMEGRPAISASAAIVQIVGTLIRQQPTAGVLGSGPMPGEGCPLGAPVRVSAGASTALDALDAIVAQVPGLTWFVLFEPERMREKLDIGLWCPDGMYFRVELTL